MPRRAAPVLVWLLGVVVAVGLSTAAVGMVGDRVTDHQVPVVSAEGVQDELAGGTALGLEISTTTSTGATPDDPPATGPGPAPSAGTAPVPASSSAPGAGGGGVPAPAPAPAPTGPAPSGGVPSAPTTAPAPDPAPAPSTTAPPAPVDEVYATSGGTAAVRCTGSTIELRWATPAAGFGIDGTPKAGPGEVEVRFRGEDSEVRVRASCQGGVPVEEIEER